jgi:hypothetical protein
MKDIRSAIDIVRDASKVDLIIVSVFLLPFLLGIWSTALNAIHYLDEHEDWRFICLMVVSILYCVGLVIMKTWDPRDEQLKRAGLHIANFLKHHEKWRWRSFEAIREHVNEKYNDDFLNEMIEKNPARFRRVKVKRHGQGVPGIGLVEEELDS